jgi:hypothetical protein
MTQEEIDELKQGDVIFYISSNTDGTRVFVDGSGTLYVRYPIHGQLNLSHSPSVSACQWPSDGQILQSMNYCLRENRKQTLLKVATELLRQRVDAARRKQDAAQEEFTKIGKTAPNSIIDFESLENAK